MKLLVALLFVTTLSADREIGVELLYWKPSTGGFDYAVDQLLSVNASLHNVRPGYRVGVRAYTSLDCLYLSGLYLRRTDSARARGTLTPAFASSPVSEAVGRLVFRYWNGELSLRYPFLPWMSADAAVRYVGLEEFQQVGAGHQLLQLYGAGPGVGLSSRLHLSDAFFFATRVTGFALIAERKTTGYAHDIAILPAFTLHMAFRYVGPHFSGALGYALDYIFDAAHLRFPFLTPQRSLRDTGFAGPFAQASLLY